jgi:hypothetical protein
MCEWSGILDSGAGIGISHAAVPSWDFQDMEKEWLEGTREYNEALLA